MCEDFIDSCCFGCLEGEINAGSESEEVEGGNVEVASLGVAVVIALGGVNGRGIVSAVDGGNVAVAVVVVIVDVVVEVVIVEVVVVDAVAGIEVDAVVVVSGFIDVVTEDALEEDEDRGFKEAERDE